MSKKRAKRAKTTAGDRGPLAPNPAAVPTALRRWLFRGVIVLLPWLFFWVLEIGLRTVGYGAPMDFALRQQINGETRALSNPRFTWLFFDPNAARLVPPFSLALRKPANTCRVFVLGSSAAQGDPEPGFGIARMLEVLLQDQYPGVDFEVINAATAAINSHVIYRMARAAVELEPDLFVVYTGNNEVVGPYGAGTASTANAPSLTLLRAGLVLRSTRLGQLLGAAGRGVAHLVGRNQPAGEWRGMETFLDRQVRVSDRALQRTYAYYERNLTDICHVAQRAGVPVVLSTLAVNLRSSAPFGSLHAQAVTRPQLQRWEELYRAGARLEDAQRWADAAGLFRQAAQIDDGYAELSYRLARCELRLGRYDEAGRLYRRALDLDTLRFRADTRVNEIVRQVAEREAARRVRFVDAAQQLEARSAHGVPGDETFLDHVHFTFAGSYQLSVALLARVREALPAWVRAKDSGRPIPSEEDCARRLVFTELDRYMIAESMFKRLQQPPFTGQLDHAAQVARLSQEMATLKARGQKGAVDDAVREYQRALAGPSAHWSVRERYAAIQQRVGHTEAAGREWRVLAGQFPQYPAYLLRLARALREAGKYAEAEATLRAMTAYQAESSLTLAELARVVLFQERVAEAVGYARRAVALDPKDANAQYVLATGLCRHDACTLEQRAEAIGHLTAALAIAPDSEPVRRDLARALVRQARALVERGAPAQAVALLERALDVKPDAIDAREALAALRRR